MTKNDVMQGTDVISVASAPGVSVTILNVTNAVVTGEGPAGMTNLTAVNSIPKGSYGNFSAIVNASSQVTSFCHKPCVKRQAALLLAVTPSDYFQVLLES